MYTQLQELKARLDENQCRLDRAEARQQWAERRARMSGVCALATIGLTLLLNVHPAAFAQSPGVTLASLVARIAALEQKTAPITVGSDPNIGGTDTLLTITGVNVQIVNGLGSTYSKSGLGNLTIGYNAPGNDLGGGDVRTGSHNLILGDNNNYSSFGGLVAGQDNAISHQYATVTGGQGNTSNGFTSSISGGGGITLSGDFEWAGGTYRSQ